MSRELSEADWEVLMKLAPELCNEDGTCKSSSRKYRSILPPISMHYARDRNDFRQRIEKLTDAELDYLLCLAESGDESLTCIRPEHKDEFIDMVGKRVSPERAKKLQKFIDFLETVG
jgi:hypothetical protein